jgi:hypothetical protein
MEIQLPVKLTYRGKNTQVKSGLQDLVAAIEEQADERCRRIAVMIRNEAVRGMYGFKSGVIYQEYSKYSEKAQLQYQSSAQGEYPNVRSKALVESIRVEKVQDPRGPHYVVKSDVPHARFLEEGFVTHPGYPLMIMTPAGPRRIVTKETFVIRPWLSKAYFAVKDRVQAELIENWNLRSGGLGTPLSPGQTYVPLRVSQA